MSFTGKATYSPGVTLPELAEDVSDLVGIISPHETPLLDALGDPLREATSTHHEWLEGHPDTKPPDRIRCGNYTQVFSRTVEMTSSDLKAHQLGLADEMDYQKQERLREMLRDLENAVINAVDTHADNTPMPHAMNGICSFLKSNVIDAGGKELDESQINDILRRIWENSSGNVDLIVVGGFQKRKINAFCSDRRTYGANDTTFTDTVSIYESDFDICRIVTTQWLPQDAALLLDSSRISVLPLAGRGFHFKLLPSTGDYERGELIGEYTLELKNEDAHGAIRNLSIGN